MNTLYKDGLQFSGCYLDHQPFFTALHGVVPSVHYIGTLDGEAAFEAFSKAFATDIADVHTYRWYKPEKKDYEFDTTIVQMRSHRATLEFGDTHCEIAHDGQCPELIDGITQAIKKFVRRQRRRRPREIHLIVRNGNDLELRGVEIKRTRLDLGLYYEDDFAPVDALIRQRLGRANDKGIVLLHGLPGTGKTTYLRHLVARLRKRVLFLSPGAAHNLMAPDFIQLLISNPNSILIIEDAENIIMDRRTGHSGSSVSNLLNISDGLLADFLNVQIICTFNSALTMVDSALLRKGRLIAKYEFARLSAPKAQALSRHLGFDQTVSQPMTVAEIANPHEVDCAPKEYPPIGFRRQAVMEN